MANGERAILAWRAFDFKTISADTCKIAERWELLKYGMPASTPKL